MLQQSFIILLPLYMRKHLMITVNTSHQSFENKNSCRELIVSTTSCNKNNFTHFFVQKHHKNSIVYKKTDEWVHRVTNMRISHMRFPIQGKESSWGK